ncbi:MAG: galactokinase [Aquisalinus sp.]|nr:galactokinase [Aquisalinus sp.]
MTVEEGFTKVYGLDPVITQTVPGRVNLIGEHTDYNGGLVLPTAIARSVSVAIGETEDPYFCFTSEKFPDPVRRDAKSIRSGHWSDYPLAAFAWLKERGYWQNGAEVFIDSSLPHGSGLSSSAALIVSILKAVVKLTGPPLSDVEIACAAQEVENQYLGVPCGIMDQMAVSLSSTEQALKLDTETLAFELINLPESYSFVVAHSGIYRRLDEGRYAIRREECEAAAQLLDVRLLCHLNVDTAMSQIDALADPFRKRARHVWTEHCRVERAAIALSNGDLHVFGLLMSESHASMRDDFEVSLPVIDQMVSEAERQGALGARLTGGGFGGCFVTLVKKSEIIAWQQRMSSAFPEIQFV